MPISEDQLQIMLARLERNSGRTPAPSSNAPADDEGDLQEKIIQFCEAQGGWVLYQRMDKPTRTPNGTPDLFCFFPGALLIIVEAKARREKLKPAQVGVKIKLESIGFRVHVVHSFADWQEAYQVERMYHDVTISPPPPTAAQ